MSNGMLEHFPGTSTKTGSRIWNRLCYWLNPVNIFRRIFCFGDPQTIEEEIDQDWEVENFPNPLRQIWNGLVGAVRWLFGLGA